MTRAFALAVAALLSGRAEGQPAAGKPKPVPAWPPPKPAVPAWPPPSLKPAVEKPAATAPPPSEEPAAAEPKEPAPAEPAVRADAAASEPSVGKAAPADRQSAAAPDLVRDGKGSPDLVTLAVGGVIAQASDPLGGSHLEGGVLASLGYRPIAALEIEARYRGLFGGSGELMPAGPGHTALVSADERIQRGDLGLRYDLLRSLDTPLRLEPYAGASYQEIDSEVFTSRFIGGGGGLRVGYDPSRRVSVDAYGAAAAGADLAAASGALAAGSSVEGGVRSLWSWGAGVGFDLGAGLGLGVAYLGDAIVREHATRLTNGVVTTVAFHFGSRQPQAANESKTAKHEKETP